MRRLMTLLTAAALLTACEQDTYDKGDNSLSYLRADFVEAAVNSQKEVTAVTTDDGDRLQLTRPMTATWIERQDTTYRAVLYYRTNAGEGMAEPVSLSHISTVSVKAADKIKGGMKTDPVSMESAWLSKNGRYLNLCLLVKTGTVEGESVAQTLGMARDSTVTAADGRKTSYLRLYHDQGTVPQYYTQRLYFSVQVAGMADSLVMAVQTYEGEIKKRFSL